MRAGASLQPHTRQCRPATPRQNAKKGLQQAYRRRGLSPAAPLAQIARSALVWVEAEGVGQLGGRVAHEVEHDSFVHLCPYNSPHTLRASCIHRWTAHRTRRLALTRAPPPLSLRAQRVTPHGPVEHHALRHSIEKQSSRGRRAQQHEQQLQQQQPFRSWWSMVAAAGGATNPRTTRTPAPPPGARLLNPNPNPSPDPSQVVRRHPALVFLHSGASDFTERYAETCPHPHPYPHPHPHPHTLTLRHPHPHPLPHPHPQTP